MRARRRSARKLVHVLRSCLEGPAFLPAIVRPVWGLLVAMLLPFSDLVSHIPDKIEAEQERARAHGDTGIRTFAIIETCILDTGRKLMDKATLLLAVAFLAIIGLVLGIPVMTGLTSKNFTNRCSPRGFLQSSLSSVESS